ncbi:conserved Plasmodium protein, unknown function [Plasmodium reichenowi]|uniref:Dynein attachment factor N-terminal domain-containing protein n=1 Tax=Plasmodium reichenowi TaxID=5854 RepID=A0A060RY95_PLARE|nr:conserved Plasmodium protein, unknown function [Plasmodium reichenowi]SOV79629.1 conserved Plasmodium protein, unknown function [Plasmodium reichenowi]
MNPPNFVNSDISFNMKKVRKDFIKSIIQDEEYKKKDDKKKEIVKTCKSYKDFCDIVNAVNMKPIKKYEPKVTYEDYIHMHFSSSSCKLDTFQKNNTKIKNFFMMNNYKVNCKQDIPSLNDLSHKKVFNEIKDLTHVIKTYKDNYYEYIRKNYNCDDIINIISLIKNHWDIFIGKKENMFEGYLHDPHFIINLINFLFYIFNYWTKRDFSLYFTHDELNEINSKLHFIMGNIEKEAWHNDDNLNNRWNYIKETTL